MRDKNRNKNKYKSKKNNRINIVSAIVFLIFIIFIYNLYKLQIRDYDFFNHLSEKQHRIDKKFKSERGDIFIVSNTGEDEELFPIATNKDFGEVFIIPKNVKDASTTAEHLYIFFDQEDVIKEIEDEFARKDRIELNIALGKIDEISAEEISDKDKSERRAEIKSAFERDKKDPEKIKIRQKEINEKVLEEKKKRKLEYYSRLSKKNDPYEPLKSKVDVEILKKMYTYFWNLNIDEIVEEKNEEEVLSCYIKFNEKNELSRREIKRDSRLIKEIYPYVANLKFSSKDSFLKNGVLYVGYQETEKTLKLDWISHSMKEYRYYPEDKIASQISGYVGGTGGKYGLEGFFDKELAGVDGYMKSKKEVSDDDTVDIGDNSHKKPINGSDLILTIDRSIQFYACRELNKSITKYGAKRGSVVVMNPKTGAIITMCSWPNFDPNNYSDVEDIMVYQNFIISDEYEPGSIFKTMTMAMALNENKLTPQSTYEDKGILMIDGWPVRNSDFTTKGAHGIVDMNYVLEHSLNTGSIYAMKSIGKRTFGDYLLKFGFGEKTGMELTGEVDGNIGKFDKVHISDIGAANASFGQGIAVTPLQILMAYGAIANKGVLMKPYIVKKIINSEGEEWSTKSIQIRSVISEKTAALISGMLVNVVEGGHAKKAAVDGYYVGGKTGTAEIALGGGYDKDKTIHTFVGMAPIDDPKFVMLVKLDKPETVRYSASSAAPLFGDIAKFILNYYQVPKTR